MRSPSGWSEPGQTPEFDEYTVVLRGSLHVKLKNQEFDVAVGQAIIVEAGEWVQYSSPSLEGAEYIAVCIPAFSPETVHREGDVPRDTLRRVRPDLQAVRPDVDDRREPEADAEVPLGDHGA